MEQPKLVLKLEKHPFFNNDRSQLGLGISTVIILSILEDGEGRGGRKKRKPMQMHNWREEEENELRNLFLQSFDRKKLPGLKEIATKVGRSAVFKDLYPGKLTVSAIKNKIDRMLC